MIKSIKTMRHLLLMTLLALVSCDQQKDLVQYNNGRQLLSLNGIQRNGDKFDDPKVERISPDSVSAGDGFLAKIFLVEKEFKLVAAYVACETVEIATVDTVINTTNNYKRLDGCKNGLVVENDTIHIYFKAGTAGRKTFEEITILTRDQEKLFRTQKYTFDYVVMEN